MYQTEGGRRSEWKILDKYQFVLSWSYQFLYFYHVIRASEAHHKKKSQTLDFKQPWEASSVMTKQTGLRWLAIHRDGAPEDVEEKVAQPGGRGGHTGDGRGRGAGREAAHAAITTAIAQTATKSNPATLESVTALSQVWPASKASDFWLFLTRPRIGMRSFQVTRIGCLIAGHPCTWQLMRNCW